MKHTNENLMNWLKSAFRQYVAEDKNWTYHAIRIEFTETSDLIYATDYPTSSGLERANEFKQIGLWHIPTRTLVTWEGKYWMILPDDHNGMTGWSALVKQASGNLQAEIQRQVNEQEDALVAEATETEQYWHEQYKVNQLVKDAIYQYLTGEAPFCSTPKFEFTAKEMDAYLNSSTDFLVTRATEEINEHKSTYTIKVLNKRSLAELCAEYEVNPPERLRLCKSIRDAVKDVGATKVTLSLKNSLGEGICLRYPVDYLMRTHYDNLVHLYFNSWPLGKTERQVVQTFKSVNGAMTYYEKYNIFPEDIVSITYKKKTLWKREEA